MSATCNAAPPPPEATLEGTPDHLARLEPAPGRDGGRAGQAPETRDQAVVLIGPPRCPVPEPAVGGGRGDQEQRQECPAGGVEGEEGDRGGRGGDEQGGDGGPEDVAPEGAGRNGLQRRVDRELGGGIEEELLRLRARQQREERGRDAGIRAVAGARDVHGCEAEGLAQDALDDPDGLDAGERYRRLAPLDEPALDVEKVAVPGEGEARVGQDRTADGEQPGEEAE